MKNFREKNRITFEEMVKYIEWELGVKLTLNHNGDINMYRDEEWNNGTAFYRSNFGTDDIEYLRNCGDEFRQGVSDLIEETIEANNN